MNETPLFKGAKLSMAIHPTTGDIYICDEFTIWSARCACVRMHPQCTRSACSLKDLAYAGHDALCRTQALPSFVTAPTPWKHDTSLKPPFQTVATVPGLEKMKRERYAPTEEVTVEQRMKDGATYRTFVAGPEMKDRISWAIRQGNACFGTTLHDC